MIMDLENCSVQETQEQIRYLDGTPVRGIAELIRTRQCILKKGRVRTLAHLGTLKTEFGQIGWLTPNVSDGENKFRIAEIVPTLKSNPGADDDLLRNIEHFIAKDSRGEIQYNVTIFKQGADFIVKDGNKRSIAFYERRREAGNDCIEFPVFVVYYEGGRPG
jgi:hypothetical protein